MMSKKKYNEDEYRFAAAKLSCRMAGLVTDAQFSSLCECGSSRALRDRLPECGITVSRDLPDGSLETLLTAYLGDSYAELADIVPDSEICALMQARFDCHNLKTAIKCRKAGIDPTPYLIDSGKLSGQTAVEAVQSESFCAYPATVSKAAAEALRIYAENASARTVDTLLDTACFDYMAELSASLGCAPVSRLFALKADFTNLITLFRIRQIRNAELANLLAEDSFVRGGFIKTEMFRNSADNLAALSLLEGKISAKRLLLLRNALQSGASVDDIAALADSIFYSETADEAKQGLLGIYPVIAYVMGLEYQVKNIRILASGLDAGKTPEKLKEELRRYV